MRDQRAAGAGRDPWLPLFGAVTLVALLVPVWAFHSFPSQDGPDHVYNARLFLMLLQGRAGTASAFYDLHLAPFPNWFSHAVLSVSMTVLPPLWADRALITAYVIALPASFGYALASAGSGRGRLFWLCVPLVYGRWLHEGYYNRSLSLVPLLLGIGYLVRRRGRLGTTEAVVLGSLALWAYSCTVGAFVVFAGTVMVLTAAFAWEDGEGLSGVRSRLAAVGALVPGTLLLRAFHAGQAPQTTGPGPSFAERALYLGGLYDVVAYDVREAWIAGAFALAIAVGTAMALVRRLREPCRRWEDGLLLVAAGLAVAYFLVPTVSVPGVVSEPLHFRISPHVLLALLLWLTMALPPRAGRALCGVALLTGLGLTSVRSPDYRRLNDLIDEEVSVAPAIPVGSVFLPLSFDHEGASGSRQRIPEEWIIGPLRHAGSRVAVLRDLVSVDNYQADTLHFPLRYRTDANANELLQSRLDGPPGCLRIGRFNRLAPRPIEYVLVFGRDRALTDACARTTLTYVYRHYERVAVSAGGLAEVFRRRPE